MLFPSSMLPLVSGINSQLPSLNPALISPILPHPVLWVAFPPSSSSTHHSHHPSPLHSFIPGLKLSFSANLSHHSLPFFLLDWLHGFPGLFTDTSEYIRFYSLVFHSSCSPLSAVVLCCRLIWLMSAFDRMSEQHFFSYRIGFFSWML